MLILITFIGVLVTLLYLEKRRVDAEYNKTVSEILRVRTEGDAKHIEHAIERNQNSLHAVEAMYQLLKTEEKVSSPEEFLKYRNNDDSVRRVEYATMAMILKDAESMLGEQEKQEIPSRFAKGEIVVSTIHYDEKLANDTMTILLPIEEEGNVIGAFYSYVNVTDLFLEMYNIAMYSSIKSVILAADDKLIYSDYDKYQGENLLDMLQTLRLNKTERAELRQMMHADKITSTVIGQADKNYYITAVPLKVNDWQLISFVQDTDILLGSESVFSDMVRISSLTLLLTVGAALTIYFQLLVNRERLKKETQRLQASQDQLQHEQKTKKQWVQRWEKLFSESSVLNVIINGKTLEIEDVNQSVINAFGGVRENFIGQKPNKFILLPTQVLEEKFRNIEKSELLFLGAPHRLIDGTIKYFDLYASIIFENDTKLIHVVSFETTDRESYREELFKEKEFFKTTIQSIGDGVVVTDEKGKIKNMNRISENLTGWTCDDVYGKDFSEIFELRNELNGKLIENPIKQVLQTGKSIEINQAELVNRVGKRIPIADSTAPIYMDDDNLSGVVMVFRDVTEERQTQREIEYLSRHDAMTGLHNRYSLDRTVTTLEEKQQATSVIMIDVNGLKMTNDVFGHHVGDELLRQASRLCAQYCDEQASVIRYGGDEFLIILPNQAIEEAEAIIQNIQQTEVIVDGSNLPLSLSLGCASASGEVGSIHAAIQEAEKNMYQQKLLNSKSYRNGIISTLLSTIYERSSETETHSKRLETYSTAIAQKLELSSKDKDELALLSLLHDIGKVGINLDILNKPGKLTEEEWQEMRRHTEIGYRIARETPELAGISELILSHHERWDGTGYPHGLKGEEIPLPCRIISVVDAYDAMTHNRVYRLAMSKKEALTEIRRNKGTQFDPMVAQIFIDLVNVE
jgi:diguanylate cyclase (GGDEF)-like protein/PAS domain S-box-containing protein